MRKLTLSQMQAALKALESLSSDHTTPSLSLAMEKLKQGIEHQRKARERKEISDGQNVNVRPELP